jgi:hypothetical protein
MRVLGTSEFSVGVLIGLLTLVLPAYLSAGFFGKVSTYLPLSFKPCQAGWRRVVSIPILFVLRRTDSQQESPPLPRKYVGTKLARFIRYPILNSSVRRNLNA